MLIKNTFDNAFQKYLKHSKQKILNRIWQWQVRGEQQCNYANKGKHVAQL